MCRKLHTELPDLIVPYKRYSAEVIVAVSNGNNTDVPQDGRTGQKIKAWFKRIIPHLQGVWHRQVALGFGSPSDVPDFTFLVRLAVNTGYWLNHPFGRIGYAV